MPAAWGLMFVVELHRIVDWRLERRKGELLRLNVSQVERLNGMRLVVLL